MNKYRRWYDQLMARARMRVLDGYSERHHINPRSLGGSDHRSNIVRLTYREHFLAHWLLTQFTTGSDRKKMLHAMLMMSRSKAGRIVAGWQYETARQAQRQASIGNQHLLGYVPNEKTRKQISKSGRKRPHADLTGQAFGRLLVLSKSERRIDRKLVWFCKCECGNVCDITGKSLRNGYTKSCGCLRRELMSAPHGPMRAEVRLAISKAKAGKPSSFKGKHHSQEAREKLRAAAKAHLARQATA